MKTIQTALKRFLSVILFRAFAEEPTTPAAAPNAEPPATPTPPAEPKPSGAVNFEDLIAKARKEEKEKLYPEIEKHKKRADDLLLVIAERDKALADLQAEHVKLGQELDKAKAATGSNTASTEATATISTLERTIETMKSTHEAQVNALNLEIYKMQKLTEVGKDNLLPELVIGTTQAEIDASIEASKARLASIRQSVMSSVQMPGAVNPNSATVTLNLEKSPEEISRMTATEYAAYRTELAKQGLIK